jgi:TonB family protein
MIDQAFMANLLAWSGQVTLITAVAAALIGLLRMSAPGVRYAWWRTVLAICLLLPAVQPWRMLPAAPVDAASIETPSTLPGVEPGSPGATAGAAPFLPTVRLPTSWPAALGAVLVAGAVLRFAWLGAGLLRLRRLRGAGERAAPSDRHDELATLTEAGAEIRYVPVLGQPVTFGIRRPVVLLPESLGQLPEPVQRAVLAHELWHVKRRDWAWILVEEGVRAVLWFHPAVWFLVSRIQLSREEVVDELTVLAVGSRRSYLEALLAFADEPPLCAAAPFARRRHLFQRMLLISKEAVMSSRRIIVSSGMMVAILVATGWYGSAAMPLTSPASIAAGAGTVQAQLPPRDHRPGQARPATSREEELKAQVAKDPGAPTSRLAYIEIAKLQEARGATSEAEATLQSARAAFPSDSMVLDMLGSFYNRAGDFDRAVSIIEDLAAMDPSNPQGQHRVAVFYQEKVQKDQSLTPTDRLTYIQKGIDATDRALALKPDYVDAMIYKSILLRHRARVEDDPTRRTQVVAEADTLRDQAMELRKAQGGVAGGVAGGVQEGVSGGVAGGVAVRRVYDSSSPTGYRDIPPTPPPPPPPPGEPMTVDGMVPVRIGGDIKPPRKVRDVRPAYPQEAMDAGVQGVVIIEATIDSTGLVRETRVLRSLPMLDEAAQAAVRQWEFTPTLLNGAPVPVIMTVTVNFTLQ